MARVHSLFARSSGVYRHSGKCDEVVVDTVKCCGCLNYAIIVDAATGLLIIVVVTWVHKISGFQYLEKTAS